jgi:hypothetical protein
MNDLGFRRRAFRQRPEELDYDFCARRYMEHEERRRLLAGRTIWGDGMGPYPGQSIGEAVEVK